MINIITCYLDLLVYHSLFQTWQNITSAPYKGVGGYMGWGGVDRVGGGLRLPFRHNGTSCCAKGAVNGLQTTSQAKAV